jgi:outer membrane protein OmpA-like peptidoglycan-associated protein
MRHVTAAAVTMAALLLSAATGFAHSGLINTRFDSGVSWYLDKPSVDAPLYPGFHGTLSADAALYRRLSLEVAGSVDSYRYGPDQIRSALFVVRTGPMFVPIDFDGGTGWIEATVGYARLHSRDCVALAGGLGYMAQYGRLGLGLFSRFTQVLAPEGWGSGIKILTFGISAGVVLRRHPQSPAGAPAGSDGDGSGHAKDRCSDAADGAGGCGEGAKQRASEKIASPPAKTTEVRDNAAVDAPLPIESAKVANTDVSGPPTEAASDDNDQDGVLNAADQCPVTTLGFPVDVTGCPVLRDRFALSQVSFAPLTARPRKEAFVQIDELAALLRERPGVRLKITAYVDIAKDKPMRVLRRVAKQRAVVVAELLAARGIAARRMKAVGSDKPDIDEVEFVVSGSTKVVKPKPPRLVSPAPAVSLNPPPAAAAPTLPVTPPPAPEASRAPTTSLPAAEPPPAPATPP